MPDRGTDWPVADPRDSLYQKDYRHYMRLEGGHGMPMAGQPMRMPMHMKMGAH